MADIPGIAKKSSKALEAILAKLAPTAEAAVALKGPEREAYLKILDKVQGPKAARSAEMGVDLKSLKSAHAEADAKAAKNNVEAWGGDAVDYTGADEGQAEAFLKKNPTLRPSSFGSEVGGEFAGDLTAGRTKGSGTIHVHDVNVEQKRKGAATEMYRAAERHFGLPLESGVTGLSDESKALWAQKNKAFGNKRLPEAAFDKRFKDSPLLLAGAAGAALGVGALAPTSEAEASPLSAAKSVAKVSEKMSASKAEKVLEGIKTAEQAVALKGPERSAYLEALDALHGPQAKRAKDLGFDHKTYYHGTPYEGQIDSLRRSGDKTSDIKKAGKGVYVTDDPDFANGYVGKEDAGAVYPLRVKNRAAGDFAPDEEKLAKEIIASQGLSAKGPREKLRSTEEGLHAMQRTGEDPQDILKKAQMRYSEGDGKIVVAEPNEIRSTNAAFDPRFKNSALLLAGGAAMPTAGLENPAEFAAEQGKAAYDTYDKYVQQPVSKAAKYISNKLIDASVPTEVRENVRESTQPVLQGGLEMLGDPTNFIAPGMALAGTVAKVGKGFNAAKAMENGLAMGGKAYQEATKAARMAQAEKDVLMHIQGAPTALGSAVKKLGATGPEGVKFAEGVSPESIAKLAAMSAKKP